MNLKHEFNRISHLFQNGVEQSRQTASTMADSQARLARRMRQRMDTGARSFVGAEEAVVRHVRQNSALYGIGVALILGALIAKLFLESRESRQAPLL